jgi:hypothetical protein
MKEQVLMTDTVEVTCYVCGRTDTMHRKEYEEAMRRVKHGWWSCEEHDQIKKEKR